jgi:antitoxin ParD1/3/4
MTPDEIADEDIRKQGAAQAVALQAQARAGGLRFEAYLPPELATWILDKVARGVFADPSEAVFVLLGEQRDLEPHVDLRQESMRRSLQAAMDDPRPGTPADAFLERLRQKMEAPRPAPAVWARR